MCVHERVRERERDDNNMLISSTEVNVVETTRSYYSKPGAMLTALLWSQASLRKVLMCN